MSQPDSDVPPAGEQVHMPKSSLLPLLTTVGVTLALVGVTLGLPYLIVGKLEERGSGVCTGREHEDERGQRVAVSVRPGQVKGRRLDVLAPKLGHDKLEDGRDDLVRAKGADDEHALELTEAGLKVSRQHGVVRLLQRAVSYLTCVL